MNVSAADLQRILHPEPLTPEQERREQVIQAWITGLGVLDDARLRQGITVDLEFSPLETVTRD